MQDEPIRKALDRHWQAPSRESYTPIPLKRLASWRIEGSR